MALPGLEKLPLSTHAEEFPPEQVIFGRSMAMQAMRVKIEKIALTSVPVLIQGDSGTGKGVLARYIHSRSATPGGPFVKINCAAIPSTLLESELFGYEKGGFTGAYAAKPGRAELAGGGTLFLDGIDEIDLGLQAKLLQILQDGHFTRIGGSQDIVVQTRILCAANRSLEHEVVAGRFRQDLYYRINVINVELPPLRARTEDIADLTAYFLDRHQRRHNTHSRQLSAALLQLMEKHHWPGNVRELENMIERCVILESEDAVTAELLHWERTHLVPDFPSRGPMHLKKITRQAVLDLERKIILSVLEANRWNRRRAASELKISYRALLYKIRQAGLPPKRTPQIPAVDTTPHT
jgi:two-component system, NtrC family, response regulator AtoC